MRARGARRGAGHGARGAWGLAAAVATVAVAAMAAVAAAAMAQTMDAQRPKTLVVGTPPSARTDRVDGARSGRSPAALPAGALRIAWQTPTGAQLEGTPVVDARGTSYVVGTRGEVVAVARDGSERWRASSGAVQPGPAALLSDDTLVFADAVGEAVAVREGSIRWRAHFGRSDASHPAPLPLDDGGIVVATAHDLAALDVDGHERARVALPEAAVGSLLWALDQVVVTCVTGTVYRWAPGAREATRVGSFGTAPEGGAARLDDHTLIAVTSGGARLSTLDLVRGSATTRAVAGPGVWLGPPAVRGGTAYLTLLAPTAELAVGVDADGTEVLRALLASRSPPLSPDGGAAPVVAVAHAPSLVDPAGTVAFATLDGAIGTVAGATVDVVGGACAGSGGPLHAGVGELTASGSGGGRISGLAPLGPGAFVAACRSGSLVALSL
jgi:hypothetical protein